MAESELKIKVCGMRDPENLEQLCSIAPDFVGYIYYPESKRFVGDHPDPALFRIPGTGILKVGVFVNEQIERVLHLVEKHRLDMVQLHGKESIPYCRELLASDIPVIKALHLPLEAGAIPYTKELPYLLFDTPGTGWGGTGQKFDWTLLSEQAIPRPFMLSGGVGPEDAQAIGKLDHKNLLGVDINSRFELSPGMKDIALLKDFFKAIRK